MSRSTPLFLFLFAISLSSLRAQYAEAPNALAFRVVAPSYAMPIADRFDTRDFTMGGEVEYIRHLVSVLNLSIPVRYSQALIFPNGGPATDARRERIDALSADVLVHIKLFKEPFFLYPYIYGGFSAALEDWEKVTYTVPAGLSLNFRLARHWYLSTKGEYRFQAFQKHRDNVQFSAGLLVILGSGAPATGGDSDNDGVRDLIDQCPDEPGTEATDGCPDRDLDGLTDNFDKCPDLPGDLANMGCPDSDGDGLIDPDDNCPNEAGLYSNQGCPEPDSDNDGFLDEVDECPNEYGLLNGCPDQDLDKVADKDDACPTEFGTPETNGCPDSDRDGIADNEDACPMQAGPGTPDGCPAVTEEVVERLNYVARDVNFESGQAVLTRSSYANLDEIFTILQTYTNYRMIIEGHTDSTGSSRTNQELSEQRARACYQYLVNKGVDPARLTYRGLGEEFPIADNRYAAGREQNRRVEFRLVPQ